MIEFKFDNTKKRALRMSLAWGLWGGCILGLMGMGYNLIRLGTMPGIMERTLVVAVLAISLCGLGGYVFWSGLVFKDD